MLYERFGYDGASRVTRAENDDGFVPPRTMVCAFEYDSLSNRTGDTQGPYRVDSVYDGVSNRIGCTYPGGLGGTGRRVLSQAFDQLNRLQAVFDGAGPIATWHYKGPERLERRTYGDDTSPTSRLDCGYDALPRLVDVHHQDGAGTLLARFQYGYDRAHNRLFEKRVHDADQGDVYPYDSIYRVVGALHGVDLSTVAAGQEILPETFSSPDRLAYLYDGVGNRDRFFETKASVPTTTTYTVNAANEYVTLQVGGNPVVALQHDDNGNLTDDGSRRYGYDFKNRLVRVSQGTQVIAEYSYDALDRRGLKVLDPTGTPVETHYLYDDVQCIEERDATGTVTRQYVWGPGSDSLVEERRGTAPGDVFFAHENSIGSIVLLVDGNGAPVERYRYDAFARATVVLNGATGNEYRFHGARFDPESGLIHMRARAYSPELGRFAQRDPIGVWEDALGLGNGYSFAGNSPINWKDPLGLDAQGEREPDGAKSNKRAKKKATKKDTPSAAEAACKAILDLFFPVPPIATTEAAITLAEELLKIDAAIQARYEEWGDVTGEWGPENPWYHNLGVRTRDGKSYQERIRDRSTSGGKKK